MDRKWPIIFCDDKAPVCPVSSFLDTVKPKHQVKILRFLSLLEEHGPTLPRPYADLLRDGIHELRIKLSGEQARMLYFFCYQKYIVFYFAFIKTSGRVPPKFIDEVVAYRDAFLTRVSAEDLEEQVNADA